MEDTLQQWLLQAAQYPWLLYITVITTLTLSSFGLPFPEEIVLLTSGMIANVALQEARQTGAASTINPNTLAAVCFLAVFLSDFLVFWLGRKFGSRLLRVRFFSRVMTPTVLARIEHWSSKYGAWAAAVFRFTPGVRFPGHFMCGATGLSPLKFTLTDGTAALLSVPTQVLLMAHYGDQILIYLKQFKLVLLVVALTLFIVWIGFKIRARMTVTRTHPDS
jgi:membrane protein DedA with SNARE-associated domain